MPSWIKEKYNSKALFGKHEDKESIPSEVCLLGALEPSFKEQVCLSKYESKNVVGSNYWFIDSGCTSHMTFDRAAFINYTPISNSTVDLGADSRANIVGQGDVVLRIIVRGKSVRCTIKNVRHVPTLRYQLLSVLTMGKLGVRSSFDGGGYVMRHIASGQALACGRVTNNLYALNVDNDCKPPDKALIANLSLWHQRLAHVNITGIKNMANRGVVKGVVLNSDNTEHKCD